MPPLADAGATVAPLQLLPATLVGVAYAVRAHRLGARGRAVPAWRQWCFYGGSLLMVLTVSSPLGVLADEIFWPHMVEHLLLMDIGALLLVLGLTGPLLAPLLRIRWLSPLRALAHPAVALPLWIVDLYVWHIPVLQEAAVRHEAVHALQHLMFIGCGVLMWMPLFGPLPQPAWFGNFARLVYILAVRLAGAVLANVLLWSGHDLYPFYAAGERAHGLTAAQDQVAAGGIMMVEGSILTLCLFCWLFLRAAREGEERQQLIDLADARGVQLPAGRAARAVAAGRGAELRRRIEGSN